jgi:hypothetical protein
MKYLLLLFIILYSYAAVRYHIGRALGIEFFLFVFNKTIAWSAATFLGLSLLSIKAPFPSKKTFGISSFILGFTHVSLTLILAFLGFFPNYFNTNGLSNEGLLILISGGLTVLLMIFPLLASLFPEKHPKIWLKIGKFALLANIFHPIIIGVKNWWIPGKWPLLLPPITLLTTLIYAIIVAIYWKQKKGVERTPLI